MADDAKIKQARTASLRIIYYPDPRLREVCAAVAAPSVPAVAALVERMFELMFASRGVGLSAPQVGVTARLFVASPALDTEDRRIYINPRIVAAEGRQDTEEGCLSFPDISCQIKRHNVVTIEAMNLHGEQFRQTAEGLAARIFEHELDHLDGMLIVDRMGSLARLSCRRTLTELQERFAALKA